MHDFAQRLGQRALVVRGAVAPLVDVEDLRRQRQASSRALTERL